MLKLLRQIWRYLPCLVFGHHWKYEGKGRRCEDCGVFHDFRL